MGECLIGNEEVTGSIPVGGSWRLIMAVCRRPEWANEGFLEANKKLVAENISLKERLFCKEQRFNETLADLHGGSTITVATVNKLTAENISLKEHLAVLVATVNKLDAEKTNLTAENAKLTELNTFAKLALSDADKLANVRMRLRAVSSLVGTAIAAINVQAETIADTHARKPSLLGWLFCD